MGSPGKTSSRRPGHDPRLVAALACVALFAPASACKDDTNPSPTKVKRTVEVPDQVSDKPSAFPHPDYEPPGERGGAQLDADALRTALSEGQAFLDKKDYVRAASKLRPCANKEPQSAACEVLAGIATAYQKRRRGESRYYLEQGIAGAKTEKLPPAMLTGAGEAASRLGRPEMAAEAFSLAIEAGDGSADAYARLSAAFQGVPDRRDRAVVALQKAVDLDPAHEKNLFDLATLVAQTDDTARATALFEAYLKKFDGQDKGRTEAAKRRIPELAMKAQAVGGAGSPPTPPPAG